MSTQDLRIAVLSDAHGNALGTEAVAQAIQAQAPDLTVNLGDQVWGQGDPARALAIQRTLNAVEVRGNNDERLGPPLNLDGSRLRLWFWLAEQLPADERQRLAGLPLTATLADGAVLASHGAPASCWDSLLLHFDYETKILRRRREDEIRERLHDFGNHEVYLVGHMHREETRRVGEVLLVNVGPVTWQNDGDPRARWTLLERRSGSWSAEHHRMPYDYEAAVRWMQENQVPNPEEADLYLRPGQDALLD